MLVIALGVWNVSLQNQLTQQAAFNRQVLAELARQRDFLSVMAYADGQPKHLQGAEAAARAVGRLYGSLDENTLALIVYDMPALQSDRVYQLWLIDASGNRTSGGTFTVDEQGRGWLLVRSPKALRQFQAVGITVEPEGGSPRPTGTKMMGGSL